MPVAKKEKVVMFGFELPSAICDEPFLIFPEKFYIFLSRNSFIFNREVLSQRHSQIGVQPTVKPFGNRIGKDLFHAFKAFVPGTQPVAMTNEKGLVVE